MGVQLTDEQVRAAASRITQYLLGEGFIAPMLRLTVTDKIENLILGFDDDHLIFPDGHRLPDFRDNP